MHKLRLHMAAELGFCMGVVRSIELAERVRSESDGNVTMLHELVHNREVVDNLRAQGIEHAEALDEIESGTVIISAHGTCGGTIRDAERKGLTVEDSTCPLVAKVHSLVERLANNDYFIYVFGDENHAEVAGILGRCEKDRAGVIDPGRPVADFHAISASVSKVALISQTTQDVAEFERAAVALKRLHPRLDIYNTVCRPTRRRQEAAIELAEICDMVVVVGSEQSANSNRLVSVIESSGTPAQLVSETDQIDKIDLKRCASLGVTAGASTPDSQIRVVIARLRELYDIELHDRSGRFVE